MNTVQGSAIAGRVGGENTSGVFTVYLVTIVAAVLQMVILGTSA